MELRTTEEASRQQRIQTHAATLTPEQLDEHIAELTARIDQQPAWAFGSNADNYARMARQIYQDERRTR